MTVQHPQPKRKQDQATGDAQGLDRDAEHLQQCTAQLGHPDTAGSAGDEAQAFRVSFTGCEHDRRQVNRIGHRQQLRWLCSPGQDVVERPLMAIDSDDDS